MDSEAEFLRIDEVSEDWSRCCCKPYHGFKLEVRAVLPDPSSPHGQHSDFQHIMRDMSSSWGTLAKKDKALAMKNAYAQTPVLFTFVVSLL